MKSNSTHMHSPSRQAEKVFSLREAAELFSVSVSTWKRYVADGIVPAPVTIGPGCVGWLNSDLVALQDEWRTKRDARATPTDER